MTRWRAAAWPLAALAVILAGAGAPVVGGAREPVWLAGLVVCGGPLAWRTLRGVARGTFAADVVAALAIVAALVLGEPLAGLVVVVMQTGGEALERYAAGRAGDAVAALEAEAPQVAHRAMPEGWEDIPVDAVAVGDRLLVRPGELIPVDAVVVRGSAAVDARRLTGEPMPVRVHPGDVVRSGAVNGNAPLEVAATAVAGASLYARIVQSAREAQASKAPLQRLADRAAVWFTPVTLVVCAVAWAASGDPLRVLAVLVVATPCPLLLAPPVAFIGGIDRAARRQVVVRTAAAIERLDRVRVAVFDKTGTLTTGVPQVVAVVPAPGHDATAVLALAAAVEDRVSHPLARSVVAEAVARGVPVRHAGEVGEVPGRGARGRVDGRQVVVGSPAFVTAEVPAAAGGIAALVPAGPGLVAVVAVDGVAAARIVFADALRPGLPSFLSRLAALGVTRSVLLSGDRAANVAAVAAAVGIPEARGDLLPDAKVAAVRAIEATGTPAMMVGDGHNDAPAMAAATVGVALAAHGGGITAEAADVVLLGDDVTRVADAVAIARRTMRIARQSVTVGLALSAGAMVVAAAGAIPPTVGALVQEAIDIAVVVNALRAARD